MGNEVKYPNGMTVTAKSPSGDIYTGVVEGYNSEHDNILTRLSEQSGPLRVGQLVYIPESWVIYE
jgi:hypothetical protein